MRLHISSVAPSTLRALGHTAPPVRSWCYGMTNDQIVAEIRAMMAKMPDLPFRPDTAIVHLPPQFQ